MPSVVLKKRRNINSCRNRSLWRKPNLFENTENQENFFDLENLRFNKNNNATHYLYAEPSLMRLEGGHEQQEIYYDCFPCDSEPVHDNHLLHPQLQIFEVVNELKNPKDFKGLLKQLALNAQFLYNSFRQAYCEAKKSKQSLKRNVCKENEKFVKQLDRCDMKLDRSTLNRQDNLKGNKQFQSPSYLKLEYHCKEKVCPLCFDVLEDEFKRPKNTKVDDSDCLKETNFCESYEKDLEHLSYAERCAVLRGEMPWPIKASEKSLTCPEVKNIETCSSSTDAGKSQHLNFNPVCITIPLKLQIDGQNCQTRVLETEIVLSSPLVQGQDKLSTSANKPQCQHDKSFSFAQQQNISMLTEIKPEPDLPLHQNIAQNKPINYLPHSDTFHSCLSNSVTNIVKPIGEPTQQTPVFNENTFNEFLELIKNHLQSPKVTTTSLSPPVTPLREIKPLFQTQSTQSSFIGTPLPMAPYSRTYSTQTADPLKPVVVPIPATSTAATSSQYDPKIKAKKLRTELFEEVQAALENTTTKEALKAFLQGKQFSLNANKQRREKPTITPLRKISSAEIAVTTMEDSKPQIAKKPDIPPKPSYIPPLPTLAKLPEPELPPKPSFIPKPPPPPVEPKLKSETQQTDISSVKATGHYKRNEIRSEIQEEMRDLLQQSSTKAGKKYKAAVRDEILKDFNKLTNSEKSEKSSSQINREKVLQNLRYLIEPQGPIPSGSQATILENIRYIIDPKNTPKTTKRKKYNKETKEKILEDLHILIKPREGKQVENREIRKYIIHDLRFMLETGQETFSPQRPPRSPDIGPESSRAQQMRHEREQKSPNEIRDSVLADMAKVLEVPSTGVGPGSSRAHQLRQERQQKSPNEIRDSVLADMAKVLDVPSPGVGSGSSRAHQLRQERQQKSPNEIRDSVLADMAKVLEVPSAGVGSGSSRAHQLRQERQQNPPNEIRDSVLVDVVNILEPPTNRQQVEKSLAQNLPTKRQTSENLASKKRKNKSITSLSSNESSFKSFD